MQALARVIQTEWPDQREAVPVELRCYWGFKDELTLQDGLIFKGNKVMIPREMRQLMLTKIHTSHRDQMHA